MKLLYVTATLPFGPGESFLIPEVQELLRQGCELLIVPRSPPGAVILHQDACDLLPITVAQPLFSWEIIQGAMRAVLRHPLRAVHAWCTLLPSRNFDIWLRNMAVFPKGLWLSELARQWKADHLHAHWISTPTSMVLVASMVAGIPWSCTAHRADIALNNLLGLKVAQARCCRFISASGREMARSLGADPTAERSVVLHVGVTLPDQRPPADSPPNFLCPANLYPVKGHKYLLEAMALLRDRSVSCTLDVAGQGYLRPELEALVRERRLEDRVRFVGQVSHTQILEMYVANQVRAVVVPSIDLGNNLHEGIPVSLMEAMAHGVPVVSTTTGGIPELLADGAGILVPPENPQALADALQRLLTEPKAAEELGMAGRRRICENWSVEVVVTELLARLDSASKVLTGNKSVALSRHPERSEGSGREIKRDSSLRSE